MPPDPGIPENRTIPRPRRILYDHPEPGVVNISRKRGGPGVPATYVIRVGTIHIRQRNTHSIFRACKICGHPYDHNGTPHSHAEAERRTMRRGPIQRGEALTGPDGNVYNYDGAVWIRR